MVSHLDTPQVSPTLSAQPVCWSLAGYVAYWAKGKPLSSECILQLIHIEPEQLWLHLVDYRLRDIMLGAACDTSSLATWWQVQPGHSRSFDIKTDTQGCQIMVLALW